MTQQKSQWSNEPLQRSTGLAAERVAYVRACIESHSLGPRGRVRSSAARMPVTTSTRRRSDRYLPAPRDGREVEEVIRRRPIEDRPDVEGASPSAKETAMRQAKYPAGWDEARVRRALEHY